MYHLTLCLLFVLGVDAIVPHSHYARLSRRFYEHSQTLDVFPRSSHALNSVDLNSRSSEHVHTRQLKREVTNRDWARTSGVETSPNEPDHSVNYLSKTGSGPAGQPAQPIPVANSSVEAAPASTSSPTESPADPLSTSSPHQATKTSHDGKGPEHHREGFTKHHAGRNKKMKKTMRL